MNQNVNILAYLFFGLGTLTLLSSLFIGAMIPMMAGGDPAAAEAVAGMGGILTAVILLFAALYFATGYGLLKRKSWGRVLGLVMSGLSLLSFPIGTILGAFGLYALTRPEAKAEFDRAGTAY